MTEDYRRTRYCPQLIDLEEKKKAVVSEILKDHPRVEDMHTYISKNDERYKTLFIKQHIYKKSSKMKVKMTVKKINSLLFPRNSLVDHFQM